MVIKQGSSKEPRRKKSWWKDNASILISCLALLISLGSVYMSYVSQIRQSQLDTIKEMEGRLTLIIDSTGPFIRILNSINAAGESSSALIDVKEKLKIVIAREISLISGSDMARLHRDEVRQYLNDLSTLSVKTTETLGPIDIGLWTRAFDQVIMSRSNLIEVARKNSRRYIPQ
jgi:hypothetical protein